VKAGLLLTETLAPPVSVALQEVDPDPEVGLADVHHPVSMAVLAAGREMLD
jgi:hypothetical protein